jgi:hypothetical protein
MSHRIFFHHGPDLGLQTTAVKGRLDISGDVIAFRSARNVTNIPLKSVRAVSMFRLHGLSRVIRIDHDAGSTFFAVIRLMIGQLAFVNFFKTGTVFRQIQTMIGGAAP